MTKTYTTTVVTTWDIQGEVTPEQINARIQSALNIIMMTIDEGTGYAFTGSQHILNVQTVESN
jgi:hypothetical protein